MHAEVFKQILSRPSDSHKYQYGHVLVIGGSPGMVGAPFLVAKAALRTGSGLVTIGSQKAVIDKLERRVEEIMTFSLPPDNSAKAVKEFTKERKVSVVVIGPGMKSQSADLVKNLIQTTDLPMVI